MSSVKNEEHLANKATRNARVDPRRAVNTESPVIARVAASSISAESEVSWRGTMLTTTTAAGHQSRRASGFDCVRLAP